MKAPYYPPVCARKSTPLEDVNLFNEGFVDKPLDQYWAGPFKVGEWNSSKVLTWSRTTSGGARKPIRTASSGVRWTRSNPCKLQETAELDAFTFVGATSYNAVKANGAEIRQSQRLPTSASFG